MGVDIVGNGVGLEVGLGVDIIGNGVGPEVGLGLGRNVGEEVMGDNVAFTGDGVGGSVSWDSI